METLKHFNKSNYWKRIASERRLHQHQLIAILTTFSNDVVVFHVLDVVLGLAIADGEGAHEGVD